MAAATGASANLPAAAADAAQAATVARRTLRLVIAYDGRDFHGWQRQPGVRTVQAEFEDVCRRVLREPVNVVGASRTDTGVHARGQVAHVRTDTTIPADKLCRAIGHRLPQDVGLVQADFVRPEFHATLCALRKLYRYRIFNHERRPVEQQLCGVVAHFWLPLSAERMREAAQAWVGRHDFAGLASAGSPRDCTIRSIFRVDVERVEDEIRIDVEGDGFLYHQVRNMVGTLIEIGRGHWPVERAAEILAARDRRTAGPTAPPHGLCLQWIRYAPDWSVSDEA